MAKGDFGFNGRIGCPGFGRRQIRVTRLLQKVSIIANDEEARRRRAMYPMIVTSSGFQMDVAFVSYEERARFNRWMRDYMEAVVDGTAQTGVMTVAVPKYDFLRTCIPEVDLTYGEGMGDYAYTLTMGFVGASDPLDLDLGARMAGASYFKMPESNQTTKYFYPAGRQVKGAESLDGTIFDDQPMSGISSPGGDLDPTPRGFGS